MRPLLRPLLLATIALLLASCGPIIRAQNAALAERVRDEMVGFTREQVLSCMGAPQGAVTGGSLEVWSYMSGGESIGYSGGQSMYWGNGLSTGSASSYQSSRYCIIDVVMTEGRVARVNYRGPTAGGSQCAYQVQNCDGMIAVAAPPLQAPQAQPR